MLLIVSGCSFSEQESMEQPGSRLGKHSRLANPDKEAKMQDQKFEFDFELSKKLFVNENTSFAMKLLGSTARQQQNRVLSPLPYELVLMMRAGSAPDKREPIRLVYDKPLVFLLYSRKLGRLVMFGEVHDPKF
jgi:hypothetical protein